MALCYSAGVVPSPGRQEERRNMAFNMHDKLTDAGFQSIVIDGSTKTNGELKSHGEINIDFGKTNDSVTIAAFDFIEHVSEFSRLTFRRDYPVGTYDANGAFLGGTEIESLTVHKGKLFASNGYWKDEHGSGPNQGPQVLVKSSASGEWRQDVDFGREYLTVESLASVSFTTDADGVPLAEPVNMLLAGPMHVVEPNRLQCGAVTMTLASGP